MEQTLEINTTPSFSLVNGVLSTVAGFNDISSMQLDGDLTMCDAHLDLSKSTPLQLQNRIFMSPNFPLPASGEMTAVSIRTLLMANKPFRTAMYNYMALGYDRMNIFVRVVCNAFSAQILGISHLPGYSAAAAQTSQLKHRALSKLDAVVNSANAPHVMGTVSQLTPYNAHSMWIDPGAQSRDEPGTQLPNLMGVVAITGLTGMANAEIPDTDSHFSVGIQLINPRFYGLIGNDESLFGPSARDTINAITSYEQMESALAIDSTAKPLAEFLTDKVLNIDKFTIPKSETSVIRMLGATQHYGTTNQSVYTYQSNNYMTNKAITALPIKDTEVPIATHPVYKISDITSVMGYTGTFDCTNKTIAAGAEPICTFPSAIFSNNFFDNTTTPIGDYSLTPLKLIGLAYGQFEGPIMRAVYVNAPANFAGTLIAVNIPKPYAPTVLTWEAMREYEYLQFPIGGKNSCVVVKHHPNLFRVVHPTVSATQVSQQNNEYVLAFYIQGQVGSLKLEMASVEWATDELSFMAPMPKMLGEPSSVPGYATDYISGPNNTGKYDPPTNGAIKKHSNLGILQLGPEHTVLPGVTSFYGEMGIPKRSLHALPASNDVARDLKDLTHGAIAFVADVQEASVPGDQSAPVPIPIHVAVFADLPRNLIPTLSSCFLGTVHNAAEISTLTGLPSTQHTTVPPVGLSPITSVATPNAPLLPEGFVATSYYPYKEPMNNTQFMMHYSRGFDLNWGVFPTNEKDIATYTNRGGSNWSASALIDARDIDTGTQLSSMTLLAKFFPDFIGYCGIPLWCVQNLNKVMGYGGSPKSNPRRWLRPHTISGVPYSTGNGNVKAWRSELFSRFIKDGKVPLHCLEKLYQKRNDPMLYARIIKSMTDAKPCDKEQEEQLVELLKNLY